MGWLGDLGNSLKADFTAPEGAEATATNEQYGVPEADVFQQRMSSLRQMGALYAAAGAARGNTRAEILAKIADVRDPTTSLNKQAQTRHIYSAMQDEQNARDDRQKALDGLGGVNIDALGTTEREKAHLEYLAQSGQTDAFNQYVQKISDANNTDVTLPDGTVTSRGLALQNQRTFDKEYLPSLTGLDQSVQLGTEMIDAIDGGLFSGTLADAKLSAVKLARSAGLPLDQGSLDKMLNAEQVAGAVVDLVLQRMALLGGNDSNEELRTMLASLAGPSLEPETKRDNMVRFLKVRIEDGTRAQEKAKQLQREGQSGFSLYTEFSPKNIPAQYQPVYERYVIGKTPAAPADPAAPAAPAAGGAGERKTKTGVTYSFGGN